MERRPAGWSALTLVRLPIQIVLLALGTRAVVETDIWGHMRFGLDLLATHTLPTLDHYNFTSTQPWVNLEWLSDLLFAGAFKSGGLPLLAVLRAASLACALIVFNRVLRDVAWPLRDFLIAVVIFISLPLLAAVRPQIFSVPLYALTLLALQQDAVWLPIVFAVWANLHGGWLLGLGAVLVRTVMKPSRRRALVLVACVVGTLVTPYGFALWRSVGDALLRGWDGVSEWQPIWAFSTGLGSVFIWGSLAAALAWAGYRRLPAAGWEWVWTICVGIAAARARRHIPFFAITIVLLVFAHLRMKAALLQRFSPRRGVRLQADLASPAKAGHHVQEKIALADQKLTWETVGILAIPLLAASLSGLALLQPTVSCLPAQDPPVRPESSAVRFIQTANLHGRLLMWFDWGLYAIWHVGDRLQVSYDNRRETVYSAQIVSDHSRFYAGEAPDYADRIRADYAWLPPNLPAVEQLVSRGWHILFRGPRSVILGREYRPLMLDATAPTKPCFPDP